MISKARKLRGGFFGSAASVLVAALVVLGCGEEKSESIPPSADPGAVAEQPTAPEATAEVWLTSLPEDFPSDLPLYPEATVDKALSIPESGLKVTWTTPDDAAKVATFFNDSLTEQGWSTQRVDGPDGVLVLADKGERSATIIIVSGESQSTINLIVTEES